MAEADAAAVIMEPVEQWKEDLLTGNFNTGNAAGQNIFLRNMKVLPEDQRLKLTEANTQKIMAKFKIKEHLMGAVVTRIPIKYDASGAVSARMNLIHQCPISGLGMVQRASFGRFGY